MEVLVEDVSTKKTSLDLFILKESWEFYRNTATHLQHLFQFGHASIIDLGDLVHGPRLEKTINMWGALLQRPLICECSLQRPLICGVLFAKTINMWGALCKDH